MGATDTPESLTARVNDAFPRRLPISGYDAGKKVKGRKRHIIIDTCGFLIFILVHAADIQDRDGALDVLAAIRHRFPWLRHVFADGGYATKRHA